MRKTIAVTGGSGNVAQEIFRQRYKYDNMILLSKRELDVTNEQQVYESFRKIKPDMIIHTAAMADVDQCEALPVKAIETNGIGTYYVAKEARKLGAKLIYLSSDYVFDGRKFRPYEEEDARHPLSVYGIGKLLGEEFVRALLKDATIIRTSWLFGGEGTNFVRKIIEKGKVNDDVLVVSDQVGSPTYVPDLISAMFALLEQKPGIYHVANGGSCSRYELAKSIFTFAGFDKTSIRPVTTEEFQLQAPRPAYSVLSQKKLNELGIEMRDWQQALEEYMRKEGFIRD